MTSGYASKCLTMVQGEEGSLIFSIFRFLWFKYSHHGLFQANNMISTGLQNSWKFNNQLSEQA